MTSKQAKEYLLRVRRAKREVQRYQALKAQARDLACSSTAPPDKLSVIGGKGGDVFARYAQYAATLDEKISDLYDLQNEVTCTIARVPDSLTLAEMAAWQGLVYLYTLYRMGRYDRNTCLAIKDQMRAEYEDWQARFDRVDPTTPRPFCRLFEQRKD